MKKLIALLVALSGTLAGSQAGLVFSESFNYPDGGIVANSSGIWTNASGTAGTMLVTNQQLHVLFSRSEDIAHPFAAPFTPTGDVAALFASFKVTFTDLPGVNGTYFAHFTGDRVSVDYRGRLAASRTNITAGTLAPDGSFYIGIGNTTPSGSSPTGPANGQWSTPLTTNVTYMVVARFELATGVATLWIDPTSETDTGATADDAATVGNSVYFGFRQASGEGNMLIDDLKIGTSFNDVAGANTAPLVSPVPAQAIAANASTGPIAFTVSDAESSAGDLDVAVTSSNPILVPNTPANLTLGGSGSARTVTVTPAAGQQGAAVITLEVTDGVNLSSTTFQVKVGAPAIAAIPDQSTYTNVTIPPITLTLNDPESDALTLSVSSSNPGLLPESGISITGSGNTRTMTLTPAPEQIGVSRVTVSVTDGFNTNSTTFAMTVSPRVGVVFSEDFDYTLFTPGVENTLFGAFGTKWVHVSGALSYEIMVTNPFAYLSHVYAEDLGAALNATYSGTNGYVFYTGFTVNFSALPTPAGSYFLHLKSSDVDTSNFRGKVFANTANAAEGKFRLGIANSVNTPVQFPLDLDLNTTYTVVTRFNAGTGQSALWINPTSELSPHALATDNPGSTTVGGIALRQDPGIGDLAIGPIKVGTSFSDLISSNQPQPERLEYRIEAGQLVLSWTNPQLTLESAPEVGGPYSKVAGATSPYRTVPSPGARFYRLAWP
jgi:hypothetical protein